MSRSRILLVLASAAAVGCSDAPTKPENPLATRLNEIADSTAGGEDYRVSSALYAASAVVRAGGAISTVELVIDSQPYSFNAVAMRMSYSAAACEQLKTMFLGLFESDTSTYDFMTELCKPTQQIVAWEGDDMRRIAVVHGDTGTTTTSSSTSLVAPINFWGQMSDLVNDKEWWMLSGSQSSRLVSDRGACRGFSIPEAEVDFSCRLATLRHSFDLVLQEFDVPDYEYDSVAVRTPSLDIGDSVVYDTVVFDTSIVWEPGPTHTMAMRPTSLDGLALTITNFRFPEGGEMLMKKSAIRAARINRARATILH